MINRARYLVGLAALLGLLIPAHAADVTYPKGLRVGLVLPEGLVPARGFAGFEDPDNGLKVAIAELPVAAFTSIDSAAKDGKQPPNAAIPESFDTAAGKSYLNHQAASADAAKVERFALLVGGGASAGYIVVEIPQKAAAAYPETAIRKMLASTTMRTDVPVDEQLAILPFKVANLADFKTVRIIPPGAAVTLSDAEGDGDLDLAGPPYVVVSVAPSAPGQRDDRDRIARDLAEALPGLKNMRITSAEPMRIVGSPGYEIRINATTAKGDKDISIVQWLRFGTSATLRIVGGATREDWAKAFPRFRAVRDGIDPQN
jgi:hypothetical protein